MRLRNQVKNAFAQIETLLQRRFDLIPNLVETVKGYQIHEKELLENVAAARSGFLNAGSNQEKMEVYNDVNGNLVNLFRCTKYHPEELQKELERMDNELLVGKNITDKIKEITDGWEKDGR